MDFLQLAAALVGQLAIISQDPALGYRGQGLVQALALLSTILLKGEEARAQLEDLADHVAQMAAEGREPTKTEWQGLRDLSKAHHDVLNPSPPPPPEPDPADLEPGTVPAPDVPEEVANKAAE